MHPRIFLFCPVSVILSIPSCTCIMCLTLIYCCMSVHNFLLIFVQDVENGRSRVDATERRSQAEARLAEAKGNLEVSKTEVS